MKVLIISNNFPPKPDGVGDYSFKLAEQLLQFRTEVIVLTSTRVAENQTSYPAGLTVLPIIKSWNFASIFLLRRTLLAHNPDKILFQYVPYGFHKKGLPFFVPFLLIFLKLLKYPVVTTFHEVSVRVSGGLKSVFTGILQRMIAYVISVCSEVIITTNLFYASLLEPFKRKVEIIRVGSNISFEGVEESVVFSIKQELAPNGEIIITSFGANPRSLKSLKIISKELLEKGYKVRFLLLGGFPEKWILEFKDQLDDSVANAFTFTGFVAENRVAEYLIASDIYLALFSVNEKMQGGVCTKSGAVAAALAAGLPLLATRGDMTDSFFNHDNSILVNGMDIPEIIYKLENLIKNKSQRIYHGINGKKSFEKELAWPVIGNRYYQILK